MDVIMRWTHLRQAMLRGSQTSKKLMGTDNRKILAITVLILSLSSKSFSLENDFEEMMKGFDSCDIEDVYLDYGTHKPNHPYFINHRLTPYKIEDGFAHYKLKAKYFGLPVVELMIPAATWGVVAITFDKPIKDSRKQLFKVFGTEFTPSPKSDNGEAPELIENPRNTAQSVLMCTNPT